MMIEGKTMTEKENDGRIWTPIGGDLEASYDGHKYLDVRARGGSRIFLSKGALEAALKLFPDAPAGSASEKCDDR